MEKVIGTENRPIKMWLNEIEEGALQQARNVANLPFVFKHVALMPDAHVGYGVPIGCILASEGPVVPFAIGSDVACGMGAVKTSLTEIDLSTLKTLMGLIRRDIPVGFNKHKNRQDMPHELTEGGGLITKSRRVESSYQLGTLGSGNHFIEIQRGSDGYIWIMVHSGSRNLGKQVADHYDKLAKELNEKWFSSVPKEWKLAFLPRDTEEFDAYLAEMNYCVDFAFYNRQRMMDVIKGHLHDLTGCDFGELINIAHNYAAMENHFGKNVLVHRKGATRARKDELGIVPGSQGTQSYIVRGRGNKDSFMSCSHGAGRKMGRRAAKENLDLDAEVKFLEDQGILHSVRGLGQLDEAPGAYKDIDVVMANQEDLVEIVVELSPLAVVKG